MKRKQNNAGFSLVEVILSMAILAIISIPLLNYFSNSMRYNAMMADKQHATVLAQEVLEELKNETTLVQLDTTNPLSPRYTVPFLLTRHYSEESSTFDASGIGNAVFYGRADQIGEGYDVVVNVGTDTTSNPENATQVPQISGIDDTRDVLAMESGQYQEALVQFKAVNAAYESASGGTPLSEDAIKGRMKRTIGIDIQLNGAYYRVKVNCSYSCADLQGTGSMDTYDCAPFAEQQLQELRSIYLLYYVNQDTDRVEMNIGGGVTVTPDLYVICQDFTSVDAAYQCRFCGSSSVQIYTNVGKNSNPGQVTDEYGLGLSGAKEIIRKEAEIRKANIEVKVYKKGKALTPGEEPYITVNTAKGE